MTAFSIAQGVATSIARAVAQPGAGGGGAFDPASRFAGGQQGVWVDLNDFSTLWQDTARTTPVTAAGQTVRGITDKSGRGNHLTNPTGWVLSADGSNHYMTTDNVSRFQGAGAIAWASDKASMFVGCKKNSGASGTVFGFGLVTVSNGTFEIGYNANGALAYRRGSGSFGGRGTSDIGNGVTTMAGVVDLAGTTQPTENPFLEVLGASPSLTNFGAADSGSGNFGTFTIIVGDGVGGRVVGRIYSFFVVAATSDAAQVLQGNAWVASRCGKALANTAAPAPSFLDAGTVTNMGSYVRTSPFARAEYTTTATELFVAGNSTVYGTFPSYGQIGVYVDGVFSTTVQAGVAGAFNHFLSLSAGSKTVSFVNGLTSDPTQTGAFLGTFLTGVTANAAMTASTPSPTGRVLIYGDSIAVGANSTIPVSQAWNQLNRNDYAPNSIATEAWGFRSLNVDCVDATARNAFVAKVVAYAPERIWLAIGTNDYGLNKWNAAAFGTAYAALLDALNTALPSVPIYCQTPIVRTTETANIFGDTLGAYRTQIATAVSTRTAYATLVDGTTFLTTGDLADGVHPTNAGHVIYAAAVDAVLAL